MKNITFFIFLSLFILHVHVQAFYFPSLWKIKQKVSYNVSNKLIRTSLSKKSNIQKMRLNRKKRIVRFFHTSFKTFQKQVIEQFKKYHPLFSRSTDLGMTLRLLIDSEQERILIAIYTITEKSVSDALIKAKNRGLDVEIVTDQSSLISQFSTIRELMRAGIRTYVYYPPKGKTGTLEYGLMHNKFALFFKNKKNKQIVWQGSFNITKAAVEKNKESVVVIRDKALFAEFNKEFSELKKESILKINKD